MGLRKETEHYLFNRGIEDVEEISSVEEIGRTNFEK